MENTLDTSHSSFDDMKNEGQKTSSEELEIQAEELTVKKDTDCEVEEQSEVMNQEEQSEVETQKEILIKEEIQVEEYLSLPENSCELSEIKDLLTELSKHFESKLKYDKHKDEIIDKLHAENQSYKNDLLKKTVMPFVNEVIFLIDDYSNLYRKYSETDISEIDAAKLLKQLGNIPEDLEELLNKNGIESFSVENEIVDFSKQKIIKTVPTCEQEKDKTVCERLKKGFMMDGKTLRQEWISCYKYQDTNNNFNIE